MADWDVHGKHRNCGVASKAVYASYWIDASSFFNSQTCPVTVETSDLTDSMIEQKLVTADKLS